MNGDRLLIAQFCDDVRQEVGNKFSLMGCYGGELLVDSLPAVLPKLCVQVKLLTPKDRPFERAVLRAMLNDDLLGELEIPVQQLNATIRDNDPAVSHRLTYGAIMTFAPFVFEKEGVLRLDAETDSGPIKGTRLRLLLSETYRRTLEEQQTTP
jgi:hypothetical protein